MVHAYEIQAPILAKFGASFGTLRSAQFAKDFWSGIVQIYIESAMFVFVMVMTICLGIKVYILLVLWTDCLMDGRRTVGT